MKKLLAIFGAALLVARAADLSVIWTHPETEQYIFAGRNPTNTLSPGGAAERFILRMQHDDFPNVDVPLTNIIGMFREEALTNRYGHVRSNYFQHTFTNLPPGHWRFHVAAVSMANHSSAFSPPLILGTNPPAAPQMREIIVRLP